MVFSYYDSCYLNFMFFVFSMFFITKKKKKGRRETKCVFGIFLVLLVFGTKNNLKKG